MQTPFLKRLGSLLILGIALALFSASFHADAAPFALISPTNNWRYNDESVDLGTGWIATNYNDSTWSNSPAAIGFRSFQNGNYPLPAPNRLLSIYFVTNGFTTNYCTTNSFWTNGLCNPNYSVVATNMTPITTNVTPIVATNSFIRKGTPTNANMNIMTFYFRTRVTLASNLSGAVLTASNLIDDGAIFYINGREIDRVRMPEGPATWSTASTSNALIGTLRIPAGNNYGYHVFSVPVDALIVGDNVVAVEVHQGTTSSTSMAFQMELWAEYLPPTLLTITNQPPDIVVEEGDPLSLRVGVSGDGGHFQWYRQGVGPIPGAIADRYSIASTTPSDSGFYYLVATNAVNVVTSRVAQVTVFSDTNAPTLFDANGSQSTTNVLVSFSESVLPSTATNIANYRITNTLGGTLTVTRAVLSGTTNVLLTTTNARVPNNNYLLIVSGVRDTSPRTNLIVANSMFPISNLATNIIGFGSGGWRFYDPFPPFDVPDLGTAWRQPDYVETNVWSDGSSIFLLEQSHTPSGSPLSQSSVPISYFRYALSGYQFGPGTSNFFLRYIIDDGAVFYLNGVEVLRANMPAGSITYQTVASAAVGTAVRVGPVSLTGPLRASGNVFAAELHQALATTDPDKVFGVQLDAYVRSVPVGPVIIAAGPSDITVVEGQSATFEVVQVGGSSFQWQVNNVNINGANNASFTTNPVTAAMNNQQFRVIVNGITSTNARLRVLSDTNAPTLVAAYADVNSIRVAFSERVGAASATTVGNYLVTNSAGQSFTVTGASVANGTNVVLSFGSLPPNTYFVVVNNVRDASVTGNLIAPNSTARTGVDAIVISFASTWRYDQNGLNIAGWNNRTFNDSAWPSGAGLLDGKSPVPPGRTPTTLPFPVGTVLLAPLNGPGGRYLTNVYFRAHFNSYASGTGKITISTVVDDGAVIYLNGVELTNRPFLRMNAGTVTANTFANTSAGDAILEGPFTFTVTNLLFGDNVIAVEVHQNATGSSDVTWGGEFSVFIPSTLVPTNQPPPPCTPITFTPPTLLFQRTSGTNLIFSWTNPVTNSCGNTAVFTLQQALSLTNPPAATVWTDITTVSPHTAIGTNKARFFRLKR